MRFDGPVRPEEVQRLEKQHETIRDLMLDGNWRTLAEISAVTSYPEASISAQLRHLRKARFGSFLVEKQRRYHETSGLWEYRVQAAATLSQQGGLDGNHERTREVRAQPHEVR